MQHYIMKKFKESSEKAPFSRDNMPCKPHDYWLVIFRKSLFRPSLMVLRKVKHFNYFQDIITRRRPAHCLATSSRTGKTSQIESFCARAANIEISHTKSSICGTNVQI